MNPSSREPASSASRHPHLLRILTSPAFLSAVLGLITLAAFWPVVHCGFLTYDDPVYFAENPQVQNGPGWHGIEWAFRTNLMGNWHPAVWLSYMLDVGFFGKGPAGPHFTNLAFHVVNTILLFVLLRKLTGTLWPSWMVAALFGLHPLRVESVAWISERKDVLSAFFGFLTLLFYTSHAQSQSQIKRAGSKALAKPGTGYILALLFFLLALMSKAMLVTLPFVMLLLDYWPLQRLPAIDPWPTLRRLAVEKLPFLLCALVIGAITFITHQKLGALPSLADSPVSRRAGNGLVAFTCYLGRTFWPVQLALPYPRVDHWPTGLVLGSALLLAGVSAAAVWLGRKQPYILVGWFWFVGMLLPVSGLIQWGEQSMADRFTYLPSIGFFILLTWVIRETVLEWQVPKTVLGIGAGLTLGACLIGTRMQVRYWRDTETLFQHSLRVTQNNYVAYCNLGMDALQRGRINDAGKYFASALAANSEYAPALNNVGAILLQQGHVEDAALCIEKSVRLGPYDASAHFNLGQVRVAQGNPEEAIKSFEAALRLLPGHVKASENLSAILIRQGRMDEAIALLQTILKENPDDAEILSNLGSALAMKGNPDQAMIYFQRAVRCAPEKADTHFNLANTLLSKHRESEAIPEYQEALRLKPDYAEARRQLEALGASVPR